MRGLVKYKRGIAIVNTFKKIISKGHNPNKILVDQGGEFYNNIFKRSSKINNIKMYSTHNEGKSAVAERFIRTVKNKVFKYMAAVSKKFFLTCYMIKRKQ